MQSSIAYLQAIGLTGTNLGHLEFGLIVEHSKFLYIAPSIKMHAFSFIPFVDGKMHSS